MKDFSNSSIWDSVEVQRGGYIYHGHRINLTDLSDEEVSSLVKDLNDRNIVFSLRNATTDSQHVHAGDLTLRVIEEESVKKLRRNYFCWAKKENGPNRPVKETISDYNARKKSAEEKEEAQNHKRSFLGNNPAKWDDVMVQRGGYICHGHRINVQNSSEEQRNVIRQELDGLAIVFEERHASVDTPQVKKGDLTFRVVDPDSVKKLRQDYFYPSLSNGLPILETTEEYEQRKKAGSVEDFLRTIQNNQMASLKNSKDLQKS